jgi:hypothetical protein
MRSALATAIVVLALGPGCSQTGSGSASTNPPEGSPDGALAAAPPVPLRRAPSGPSTVVVHLRDPAGAPWDHPTQVTLTALRVRNDPRTIGSRMAEHGDVTFDAVPSGTPLVAEAYASAEPPRRAPRGTPAERFATARREFGGPAAPGGTAEVTLTVGLPMPVAEGRLVDADGRPLAGRGVGGVVFGTAFPRVGPLPSDSRRTGADGRFRLQFDAQLPERGAVLRVSTPSESAPTSGTDLDVATVEWPRDAAAPLDLGDVRAVVPPVLVTGRFVAEDGANVALDGCAAAIATRMPEGWNPWRGLDARADAAGRFEIRGAAPGDPNAVVVGHAPAGIVVDRAVALSGSAHDVELRLVAAGGIAGSVMLPPGTDAWGLVEATVEGDAAQTGGTDEWLRPSFAGGSFAWSRLRPGHATVVVREVGRTEPCARAEVEVVAGRVVRPPELQTIALGGSVRTREIRVTDEKGAPAGNADVWTRPAGSGAAWSRAVRGRDGRVRRTFLADAFDVVALQPGMFPAVVDGATGDVELVMRSAAESEVTVRLAPGVEIPRPPLRLNVRLVWRGTAESPVTGERESWSDPRTIAHVAAQPFGPDGTAKFVVTEPGRWAALLGVERIEAGGGYGYSVRDGRSTEALVTAEPQAIEIVVGADAEKWRALCRCMAR